MFGMFMAAAKILAVKAGNPAYLPARLVCLHCFVPATSLLVMLKWIFKN